MMHPIDLFDGLSDERQVYDTVKSWLHAIIDKDQKVGLLSAEGASMHKLDVEPFRKAIWAVSVREKWPQEFLHQGIMVNTGWLEHESTRLRLRHDEEHERTPNVPSMARAPPTMRKSSLHSFITKTLLSGPKVSDSFTSRDLHVRRRNA